MEDENLKNALLKKALGFESEEILEEYLPDDDGLPRLIKKKVTKKFNPPDMSALKFLLEKSDFSDDEIAQMTDHELQQEMHRLLQLLKEKEDEENENGIMQKSDEV